MWHLLFASCLISKYRCLMNLIACNKVSISYIIIIATIIRASAIRREPGSRIAFSVEVGKESRQSPFSLCEAASKIPDQSPPIVMLLIVALVETRSTHSFCLPASFPSAKIELSLPT